MSRRPPARITTSECGQAIAFIALLIAVVLGFAALAIDIGSMTVDRRNLQNAADSIALAASQELPNQETATTVANQWATKNGIALNSMTLTFTAQNPPAVPNPKVTVTLTKSHRFYFATVIGISSANVQAKAAAIRTSPGGSVGLVPWSVTQATLNAVTPGQTTVMKYDSNGVANGNFGAVRIDGNGANIYRDSATYGSTGGLCATNTPACPYSSTADLETGNMVGGTKAAVDYRLTHTDPNCDTWDETVVAVGQNQLIRPECNPFLAGGNPASLRILVIPVISSLCNGSCTVTITQFALFFLEGYGNGGCNGNHCDIKGRFISSNTNYNAQVGVFSASTLAHFVRLVE